MIKVSGERGCTARVEADPWIQSIYWDPSEVPVYLKLRGRSGAYVLAKVGSTTRCLQEIKVVDPGHPPQTALPRCEHVVAGHGGTGPIVAWDDERPEELSQVEMQLDDLAVLVNDTSVTVQLTAARPTRWLTAGDAAVGIAEDSTLTTVVGLIRDSLIPQMTALDERQPAPDWYAPVARTAGQSRERG